MDASKRSSHGNAYFTGVFGAKRIVLFDTLVESMTPGEVVAVLDLDSDTPNAFTDADQHNVEAVCAELGARWGRE